MPRSIIAETRESESPRTQTTGSCAALDEMAARWEANCDVLELTREFVDCCEHNLPIETLVSLFQTALDRFGVRNFALCSHVDPLHPPKTAVVVHNYPGPWERTISELALYEVDPVLVYSEKCALPFFWDDAAFLEQLTRSQRIILAEGASLGLTHGYTIPIHAPIECGPIHASCSIVPDSKRIDDHSYLAVQIMAKYLYHTASRQLRAKHITEQHAAGERATLTLRERQCLEFVALSKTDWEISRILGLSDSTVHTYIERAKQKLGVFSRVEAVARALADKQILYGYDALRTQKRKSLEEGTCGAGIDRRALEIRDTLLREMKRARIPVIDA